MFQCKRSTSPLTSTSTCTGLCASEILPGDPNVASTAETGHNNGSFSVSFPILRGRVGICGTTRVCLSDP